MNESTIRLFKAVLIKTKRKKSDNKLLEKTIPMGFVFSPEVIYNYSDYDSLIKLVEKSISITYATTDISTTPRYRHRIEESAITNDGGSATLIDRGLLEPDGIILVTFEVTTNPTITGGSPNNVFIHEADIHYQSTNIGTKQREPDFYV
ncbi:hypothetical protein LCGC14_1591580 [marine sediment metagenome]|uniref:Uncharacterized protein n=1 Tax=marine sediment metagenome TaxID=412755 RepID=A0A0F9IDR5_9ZZZZ